jgi:exosortase/archaeosortase family protein
MVKLPSRLRFGAPEPFIAALVLAAVFVVFLIVDQKHWWQLKPDYAFGWLVPAFVAFLIYDRWQKIRVLFGSAGPSPLPCPVQAGLRVLAGLTLLGGLMVFLFGAVYRAGSGATQPGSMALAIGFAGVLLGMVYFNASDGRVGELASGWRVLRTDARLRITALFVFPALIWILSAPLVSAVESTISLFLLRKVVVVVFTIFSLLGFPLVQEGNVLILPHGNVGVADACSGIRSLTGCLFAGSFLAAVFLDRLWKKTLLVVAALVFAFFTNLLRSLFLTAWAYAYGSDAIEGTLHDATGYAVLGLTCVGLFCLLPFFNGANWRRWLGLAVPAPVEKNTGADLTEAQIANRR